MAQNITIDQVELDGENVILYYTLKDEVAGHAYNISLYTSMDNYTLPVRNVSGDAGRLIAPGEKRIVWDTRQETRLESNEKISFEIRARLYVPFIQINDFKDGKRLRRGNTYDIAWTGGQPQGRINIELFKDTERVSAFYNVANLGYWSFSIPAGIKPGSYHLVISDSNKKDEFVQTEAFDVVRKVPLAAIVVSTAALGAVGYWTAGGNNTGDDDTIAYFPNTPSGN
jgi:hypothetical protein